MYSSLKRKVISMPISIEVITGIYLLLEQNRLHLSMSVLQKNLWNDFGASSGGNIINLVQKMHPSWNNHQVLTYLEQQIKNHNLKYAEDYEAMTKEQQRRNAWNESHIAEKGNERKSITFIDRISKLSHPNLKRYILQRRVDFEVAQEFCKEIHYHINDKHYYAIAFEKCRWWYGNQKQILQTQYRKENNIRNKAQR